MFEECIWRPFVDTQTPDNSTWDAEERGLIAHKSKIQAGHVCGGNKLEAMYIDTRRVSDDKPWHETGELMTKNTPLYEFEVIWYLPFTMSFSLRYGVLCVNKNNKLFNTVCSDYKTRFCCAKAKQSQWSEWGPWGECSKTCGGGEIV